MAEQNQELDRIAEVAESLRSQLSKLKDQREQLRREREDLLAEPRSHAEILEDVDQALAAAADEMDAKAQRIIERLADTTPWKPTEITAAVAGLVGKKVSAGGFAHFLADPSALTVLLSTEIRDLLVAKLGNTPPGASSNERATKLEIVQAKLADVGEQIRDVQATAKRAGLDLRAKARGIERRARRTLRDAK